MEKASKLSIAHQKKLVKALEKLVLSEINEDAACRARR